MPDAGQATQPESIDSLASFLDQNPLPESGGQEKENPRDDENPAGEAGEDRQAVEPPGPDEDEASVDAEKRDDDPSGEDNQPGLKFKITVAGDAGDNSTIEVDEKELIAGYQRHTDYERKTQALDSREREITKAVAERLQEGQQHYLQQVQLAHMAVRQLAGIKTPQEMASLAATDPAAWVQEQQRQIVIGGALAQLEQNAQSEMARQKSDADNQLERSLQQTWDELKKDGMDKPALSKVFDVMRNHYRVPQERLNRVNDAALVRIMRDAAAYQELKLKTAEVTKKADAAPRLPAKRQATSVDEQTNRRLQSRFAGGNAKLADLAAYLNAKNL